MDYRREENLFHSAVANTKVHSELIVSPELGVDGNTVVVLHGLGDHFGRHQWAVRLLVACGYSVFGFDWPGNGLSGGKRGDLISSEKVGDFLEEVLGEHNLQPMAVLAHSTGGFLLPRALRESRECLSKLEWIWFSSPLIDPLYGQPGWKTALAGRVAGWFPGLTVSTGVRPVDCYHVPTDEDPRHFRAGSHNRITLRAGADLIRAARWNQEFGTISLGVPVLLSQGAEDEVCPPDIAEHFLSTLSAPEKTFVYVSEARHEPFREPRPDGFLGAVRAWVRRQRRRIGGETGS